MLSISLILDAAVKLPLAVQVAHFDESLFVLRVSSQLDCSARSHANASGAITAGQVNSSCYH